MRKYLFQIHFIGMFFLSSFSNAQYGDFVRPEKAVKGYDYHILLTNFSDFKYLKTHLPEFSNIEKLRIDGAVDVNLLSEVANKLDELEELQLRNFQGILSDNDLENLEWIPNVYIFVPQNREDAILLNNYWKRFHTISLEFEEVPEHYDFLKNWTKCKELQLIAPWRKTELDQAMKEISGYLPNIQKLAISVDVVTDLPQSIRNFKKIKKLTLIDAAALKNGVAFEALSEVFLPVKIGEKDVQIGFGVNVTKIKKAVLMPLVYLTIENTFLTHELKHIKKIYPDGEKVEDFEWIEPEIKLDFVENLGYEYIEYQNDFPKSISKPLIEDFNDGSFVFEGNAESDMMFCGENRWTVSVPKSSLIDVNHGNHVGSYQLKVKVMSTPEKMAAYAPNLVYDSIGQLLRMNASVILDIQFFKGKELLSVKPGYFIQFAFVGQKVDQARFFAMKNQKFVHFYEYDYDFNDDKLQNIQFYDFHHGSKTAKIVGTSDVTLLDDKFETEGYYYLLKPFEDKSHITKFQGHLVGKLNKQKTNQDALLKRGSILVGLSNYNSKDKPEKGLFELQLYDKAKHFFPELNAFKNYPLVFQTAFSKKDVNLLFFKTMKFYDVRIRQFGGHWVLELKSNEGLWQIQILEPKERFKNNSSKAKSAQKKFLKRIEEYNNIRNQKLQALLNFQNKTLQNEIQGTIDMVFGGENVPKNKSKNNFLIRSTGRFAYAAPDSFMQFMNLEIIPCEPGKIPLKVSQFEVVYANSLSGFTLGKQDRYSLNLNVTDLLYLICKDDFGRVYYLNGQEFRKLGLENNTLAYVELEPLPVKYYNQESLFIQLNKKKK
jgi:hypothetical protein